ncbi:MAG: FAR7a/AIG1-like family protein [Marmoricola sp.]|nr:FAR7a/AIG1-like family protein [Marmoricola sp.]
MTSSPALRLARLLVALLGLAAVVTEVATLVERGTLVPANFFSFFTIQSNLLAAAVLLASSYAVRPSRRLDLLRGASTVYMVVVLVVFAVLLSGLDGDLTAVPWDNTVLHRVVPVAVVLDWVATGPGRRVPLRTGVVWLAYPVLYLGWTLVRGPLVGWYPYPFTDPAHGGYGRVALTAVVIAVFTLAVTWAVTRRGPGALRTRARRRPPPVGGPPDAP